MVDRNAKMFVSMRYWLLGREWFVALDTMEFAAGFHTGMRKDGITPEFLHQVGIAHNVRHMSKNLMFPEETLSTVFLHDVCEDYDVGFDEISQKFGQQIATSTRLLTKVHRGVKTDTGEYFRQMAGDPIASVVKGYDRINNVGSMVGVFSTEKQISYITEVEDYFFPMLKAARRNFPRQESVYEVIKFTLESQCSLIRAMNNATT